MNFETMPKKALSGFIKIYQVDALTSTRELILEQPNMILNNGSRIIAYSLAGVPNSKIWGMYIGYNNDPSGSFEKLAIEGTYAHPFRVDGYFGYIREPLTFDPTYLSDAGYVDNIVLFSTMITAANSTLGSTLRSGTSSLFEVGLIAALDPSSADKDLVFSRTQFNSITYNSNYNLNIVWGIKTDLS